MLNNLMTVGNENIIFAFLGTPRKSKDYFLFLPPTSI